VASVSGTTASVPAAPSAEAKEAEVEAQVDYKSSTDDDTVRESVAAFRNNGSDGKGKEKGKEPMRD